MTPVSSPKPLNRFEATDHPAPSKCRMYPPWSLTAQTSLAAGALTAEHGLGASTVAQEKTVVRATIAQVRERLATWEIVLPAVEHPELGRA